MKTQMSLLILLSWIWVAELRLDAKKDDVIPLYPY